MLSYISNFSFEYRFLEKSFWLIWFLLLLPVFVLFLITLGQGPYLHPDEFVTVDLGRYILNPQSTWSIAWIAEIKAPAFLISYIGVVFQELVYEYFGQYGPRFFALIGAIAAASALVGWLLRRKVSKYAALLLGLVFLLDPILVQSYTIGRIDGWCMFLCFSACWVIRGNSRYSSNKRVFNIRLLTAGLMTGLALFVWPSAVFLFPLILMELFETGKNENKISSFFRIFSIWVIGSIIITCFLFFLIFEQLSLHILNILEAIYANSHSGSSYDRGDILRNMMELPRVLKFSPFIVLGASLGFIRKNNWGIFLASLLVATFMICSLVYINRVQYLVPYLLLAVSTLFEKGSRRLISLNFRKCILILLLIWSIGLSVGARTYLVFGGQNLKERELLEKAALAMVGEGEHKVYIPYEFYYSGRSLNWQMYRAYLANNNPLTAHVLQQILPHVDYVIMNQPSEEFENEMIKQGFEDQGVFQLYENPPQPFNGITTNDTRVRNLYSIFNKPYGPYKLFKRI